MRCPLGFVSSKRAIGFYRRIVVIRAEPVFRFTALFATHFRVNSEGISALRSGLQTTEYAHILHRIYIKRGLLGRSMTLFGACNPVAKLSDHTNRH